MKFKKEFLRDLVWDIGEDVVVERKMLDKSRWSIRYHMVFRHNDQFFKTVYSVGATESQDERPYGYESDEIECHEVFPVEKTIIVYQSR